MFTDIILRIFEDSYANFLFIPEIYDIVDFCQICKWVGIVAYYLF